VPYLVHFRFSDVYTAWGQFSLHRPYHQIWNISMSRLRSRNPKSFNQCELLSTILGKPPSCRFRMPVSQAWIEVIELVFFCA